MAYKDKEKQKETDRRRQQRRRDAIKAKGVTMAGCDEGVTMAEFHRKCAASDEMTSQEFDYPTITTLKAEQHVGASQIKDVKALHNVIADLARPGLQATEVQYLVQQSIPNYGQSDCECRHCQTNRANGNKHTINHGPYKTAGQLAERELNRVSLPGDPDHAGVCLTVAEAGWKQGKGFATVEVGE